MAIKAIIIDTLTGIQSNDYMSMYKKPTFDQWHDFGTDIYRFIIALSELGFEFIEILGYEGSGKSYGIKGLQKGEAIWFNCDKKNPTWSGGKEIYGTKLNPNKPWHMVPQTYNEIIEFLAKNINKFENQRYAFLLGHIENFKSANEEMRERLKILGKLGHKQNIEGKFENVFYSEIDVSSGTPKYYFKTQNSGFNTARSMEGLFPPTIPNDYGLILKKFYEQ